MPLVVVVGGMIQCSHGGQVRLASGDSRLGVDGNAVLVQGQEAGHSFAPGGPGVLVPCPFVSGSSPSPCSATQPAIAGVSTKLTIGGLGALLDTANGIATNAPPATWSILSAGQAKLDLDG